MRAQIILEGKKREWRKSGRRIMLGDDTGGEVIRFLCAGVWISTGLPSIHIYIDDQMYILSSHIRKICLAPNRCRSQEVPVLVCN